MISLSLATGVISRLTALVGVDHEGNAVAREEKQDCMPHMMMKSRRVSILQNKGSSEHGSGPSAGWVAAIMITIRIHRLSEIRCLQVGGRDTIVYKSYPGQDFYLSLAMFAPRGVT